MVVLLLACVGPSVVEETSPAADDSGQDSGGPVVDETWGVAEECPVRAQGGFDDWYDTRRAVLVYGDSAEDEALAQEVYGWYGDAVPIFDMVAASALTEEDRSRNLFVLGTPATNSLFAEMNGALPVYFEDGSFLFGGHRYAEPSNGIALIHPSPFAADRMVLLYGGNSLDGAYTLFTIWTGRHDYETTRGQGLLIQEGDLCRSGLPWTFYAEYAEDNFGAWEEWVAGLASTASAHHVFHYLPDSEFAADVDWMPAWQEERYDDILEALDVDALEDPIQTYLYPDNATKGEVTGDDGNGHANVQNLEVHEVYGDGVYAVGAHEDTHVVAYHRIGQANSTLMGEGLAVMVDRTWWGEDLDHWASTYADAGEIPPLRELVDDFWSYDEGTTYPLAGHFVAFLVDGWGIDALKRLYVAEDLDVAFEDELGLTLDEVEAAWLASIP